MLGFEHEPRGQREIASQQCWPSCSPNVHIISIQQGECRLIAFLFALTLHITFAYQYTQIMGIAPIRQIKYYCNNIMCCIVSSALEVQAYTEKKQKNKTGFPLLIYTRKRFW